MLSRVEFFLGLHARVHRQIRHRPKHHRVGPHPSQCPVRGSHLIIALGRIIADRQVLTFFQFAKYTRISAWPPKELCTFIINDRGSRGLRACRKKERNRKNRQTKKSSLIFHRITLRASAGFTLTLLMTTPQMQMGSSRPGRSFRKARAAAWLRHGPPSSHRGDSCRHRA